MMPSTTPTNFNLGLSSTSSAGAMVGQGGDGGGIGGAAGSGGYGRGQNDSAAITSMLSPPNHNLNGATINNAVLSHQGVQMLAGGGGGGPWGRNMQPMPSPA